MSLSIFILMLSCWILVSSLQGYFLREHDSPNTEDAGRRVLDAIVFIAFMVGLLWGFMNYQWYLVIFLLAVPLLIPYSVL